MSTWKMQITLRLALLAALAVAAVARAAHAGVPIVVPTADTLAGSPVILFGRICEDGTPRWNPQFTNATCDGGTGTTAQVALELQTGADANHNPVADHALTFDGQPWPASAAGADPCVSGPSFAAGTNDHVVTFTTTAADRESYAATVGDPPVTKTEREELQISLFTTEGKLKSPFAFVEAADTNAETPVSVKWNTPKAADVQVITPVTFTFVVRDSRGGTDWTTRTACVTPATN